MPASFRPPTRRIPKYGLHKATGQGIVRLEGKDHYLGQHGTEQSRQRYDRLIAEWLASGRQTPRPVSTPDLTIIELVDQFWGHASTFYAKLDGRQSGELENYRQALKPLKALYGLIPARDFGPLALAAVGQRMIEAGWCRTFINKQLARLKHVFAWAVSRQLIPVAVHQALLTVDGFRKGKTAARESDPVRPVPDGHVDAIFPFVSAQVRAMIYLQLLTGMRPGEVVIMRGTDIEMGGKVWVYRPQFHKTEHHGHTREIQLGPKAQELIRPFLKADVQAYLFSPRDAIAAHNAAAKMHRHQAVAPPRTERKVRDSYDVASYRRAIARACRKAAWAAGGMIVANAAVPNPVWHPHQLRHNAGTKLRRQYGIEVARVILGHRSAGITEIYAEQDVAKAQEVMAAVG